MKTAPIVTADIAFDGDVPFSQEFGDVYHARAGAFEQARHVFLAGNGLPGRWQGRERFVVLETGFGLGNNFLATWAAWRDDPQRCARLCFISIEKHPPTRADLQRALSGCERSELARELVAQWPPLTPNMHALAFDGGRVRLLLALGDVAAWLPEIVASVDAFYLDGFAPARNPQMWDRRLLQSLGRHAATGATAATWSVAREVRDGLGSAGFAVERAPGFGTKREMTVARYAPRFVAQRAPARTTQPRGRDVMVIGAGLAGAAVARALFDEGLDVEVLDAHTQPALGASGNPAGLFHGTVHADDGPHARFNRAAALAARAAYRPLLEGGSVPGQCRGLLRLGGQRLSMALPHDYVQWLDVAQARQACGWPVGEGGWLYPGGGWLDPRALVAQWLAGVRWRGGVRVQSLRPVGNRWQALAGAQVVAEASTVVLANAHDAMRLLGQPAWPIGSSRGQFTRLPAGTLPAPRMPVAGAGYAIGLPDGALLCGATSQADDPEPAPRAADHRYNLERLSRLAGDVPDVDIDALQGRVAWRMTASDRLPLIGAAPVDDAHGPRLEQPRFVPRVPGLSVLAALGSRGITWAPLGGQALAAWITGAPLPLEASLVDAVDPARFVARRFRTPSS